MEVTRLAWAYVCLLAALLVSWRLPLGHFWVLTWLSFVPAFLYLLVSLALAWRARRGSGRGWRVPVVLSILLAVFGVGLPGLKRPVSHPDELTVMSLNLMAGKHLDIDYMRGCQADLILLQEAPRRTRRMGRLREALPDYQLVRMRGEDDLAVFSRLPIVASSELRPLPNAAFLLVDVEFQGRVVRVINVSYAKEDGAGWRRYVLGADRIRELQTDRLLATLDDWKGPLLVGGDFNTPPNCPPAARLRGRLQDVFLSAGLGFGATFPTAFPLWRLDYLYCNDDFRPLSCRAPQETCSDHMPVISTLELRKAPR